jgi:hypothetical protein
MPVKIDKAIMNQQWIQAVTDAIGFFCGGVGGMLLGKSIGLDIFAPGYSNNSLGGIGGGLGLQLARYIRKKMTNK